MEQQAPLLNGEAETKTLKSARVWDVSAAPPTTSIKGAVVPAILTRKRRRISVEIHRLCTGTNEKDFYEECFVRILRPEDKEHKAESKKRKKAARKSHISSEKTITSHFDEDHFHLDNSDDHSVLATELGDMDNNVNGTYYEGWKTNYSLPLKTVEIKSVHKRDVTITVEYKDIKHVRTLNFDLEEDATSFANFIEQQKNEEDKRSRVKMSVSLGGLAVKPSEKITFLVEMVSASNLMIADSFSSDPFVTCFLNGKEIHKTSHISRNLNPVWTLKTGSLFLFTTLANDLFRGEGLLCEVSDYDTVGKNELLGRCLIPPKQMYETNGERLEFALTGEENTTGTLAVRIRRATAYDIRFMRDFDADKKKQMSALEASLKKAQTSAGGKSALKSVVGKNKKTERHGHQQIAKYRIRPNADPKRAEETTWMTKEDIERETYKDSTQWIDSGTGDAGRLYVEVLGCDNLPNLDTGGFLGNKTDAFVVLVHEDAWAETDVIDDCLRPRWLPWMKRAFIFQSYHPSSDLYIGIFDFDTGPDDHDLIGRVALNVANLQPNVVYTLTFNIYPSGRMIERNSRGTVTIRVRLEVDDTRRQLMACLEPPRPMYVNVKKKKDRKIIDETCFGNCDVDAYSMRVISAHIDELYKYLDILDHVKDGLVSLLMWRGQLDVMILGKKYRLPSHSLLAFLVGITLVERPQFIPSFCLASVSWVLLACMVFRRQDPNPWRQVKSFLEIFKGLMLGSTGVAPREIKPYQNKTEIEEFDAAWQERRRIAEERAEEANREATEAQAEAEREAKEIGDTNNDLAAKKGGISIDPFKSYMEPLQGLLGQLCKLLRIVRNIFMWEECYLAFWLSCGCFALSIVCLFVPWFFLIRWTSRIFVWSIFGPWMKLVDIYYYSPLENMSDEERKKQKEEQKRIRAQYHSEAVMKAKIDRENKTKLKAMKQYLFGKWIIRVPVLKEDRWFDYPLPQSKAKPYRPPPLALAELAMKEAGYHRIRVPGQHLEGVMIPTLESSARKTDAPVGQATKKYAVKETNTTAYVKVGSIVAGAAAITWFGVPFVSNLVSGFVGG